MKKEFKTPIIETKLLSATDSVMVDVKIFTSEGKNPEGLAKMTDRATEGYAQWKGFTVK